jgi:hypothetical protein
VPGERPETPPTTPLTPAPQTAPLSRTSRSRSGLNCVASAIRSPPSSPGLGIKVEGRCYCTNTSPRPLTQCESRTITATRSAQEQVLSLAHSDAPRPAPRPPRDGLPYCREVQQRPRPTSPQRTRTWLTTCGNNHSRPLCRSFASRRSGVRFPSAPQCFTTRTLGFLDRCQGVGSVSLSKPS